MDHWGIVRQAWAITRKERGLWGFGAIASAHSLVISTLTGLTGAIVGFTFAFAQAVAAADAGSGQMVPLFDRSAVLMSSLFERFGGAVVAALIVLFALWLLLAALDVAALGGLVHQLDAVASGARASFKEGLLAGRTLWWRTASLYAIGFAPLLVLLLVDTFAMLLPLLRVIESGGTPDLAAMFAGMQVQQPVSMLVGLVSLPLALVLVLSYRYAVVSGLPWRRAFSAGWSLTIGRIGDVVVFYLVVVAVCWVATIVAGALLGVIGVIAGALAIFAVAGEAWAVLVIVVVVALAVLASLFFVYTAALTVFTNAAWSLAWRHLVVQPSTDDSVASRPVGDSPASLDVGALAPAPLDGVPPASPVTERGRV